MDRIEIVVVYIQTYNIGKRSNQMMTLFLLPLGFCSIILISLAIVQIPAAHNAPITKGANTPVKAVPRLMEETMAKVPKPTVNVAATAIADEYMDSPLNKSALDALIAVIAEADQCFPLLNCSSIVFV
ncbi:hypothetical protein [Crocosphaera chwakensis]|nr:hypothetical protein [Crocosphaera chwakensis]